MECTNRRPETMAKMEQIPVLGRMRGKVGDLIVKRYSDGYVVSARPYFSKPRTEKQKAQSARFADAMAYARDATREPPTRELYDAVVADTNRASNTAAVSDYMRPPTIKKMDLADYSGQQGAVLKMRVENLVPVQQVAVLILPAGADDAQEGDPDDAPAGTGATDDEDINSASYLRSLHARALETGLAGPVGEPADGEWRYTTKTDVDASGAEGGKLTVVVRVTDHPGNVVEERVAVQSEG